MKVRLIDELTLQRELFCQIQQNAIDSCSIHYDSYKNWCLSGLEVEKAINDIFSKSGPFASTIGPETLPVVQELRKELERVTAERDEVRRDCAVAERNHSECLAQLAKARAQLKFAVADMEALMWHSGDGCNICKHCVEVHREPYVRLDCDLGSGCECKPEWRGTDGDHP